MSLPRELVAAVRRWWARAGRHLDVLDLDTEAHPKVSPGLLDAVAREPWTQPWTRKQLSEAILQQLQWTIEGDCPAVECMGYMAEPASLRVDERPCEVCAQRWDHGDDWRGPLVVRDGLELCPACECEMPPDSDECGCGHRPRGRALERALRASVAKI